MDVRTQMQKKRAMIPITEPELKGLWMAKVFKDNCGAIRSMDFSDCGNLLISSSDDNQILLHHSEQFSKISRTYSMKYGVDLIRFRYSSKDEVIHSSTKLQDDIRHMSLQNNNYIRYFPGHTQQVVSLCISPVNDTLLSGSLDKTLRLWDMRSVDCQGLLNLSGAPVAAFDPEGLIFAAGVSSECVKLYDLRSFDKGPFTTFKLSGEKDCDWTGLKFSRDGKTILISTNGSLIRLIDAFNGTPLHTFGGYLNNGGLPIEASFSPDSKFIFNGSTDGRVHVWNADTGYKVSVLDPAHSGALQCVQFNPKYMMLASACKNLAFWLPAINEP